MADTRHAQGTLNVSFLYSGAVAHGDDVEIGADRTVTKVASIASAKRLGVVVTMEEDLTRCTVETSFRGQRHDRVAAVDCVPGQFVLGPLGVYPYTPGAPAKHTGSTVGPKTVTVDTDDVVKLTLENGDAQTVTITAGTALTFAAIAAELNETLVDMTAFVDASGHIGVVADEVGKAITVGAVTHDAYTLLGWTAAVYAPTNPSHDPAAVVGVIVVGATAGNTVETLEW